MKRLDRVKEILENSVGGETIGVHGNFWRPLSAEQFKTKKVLGLALVSLGNPDDSNLIKALEGRAPFGSDTGTPDADYPRMPAGRPPVPADQIAFIRQWIADGCPDDEVSPPPPATAKVYKPTWEGEPGKDNGIRHMFRTEDIEHMKDASIVGGIEKLVDLASYDNVKVNAIKVFGMVKNKRMPPDEPWPDDWILNFKNWMDAGFPVT